MSDTVTVATLAADYLPSALAKIRSAGHVPQENSVYWTNSKRYRVTSNGLEEDGYNHGDHVAWANRKYPGANLTLSDFSPRY